LQRRVAEAHALHAPDEKHIFVMHLRHKKGPHAKAGGASAATRKTLRRNRGLPPDFSLISEASFPHSAPTVADREP